MANFISSTQMSTILNRIKTWINANFAGKSIESSAVTNISYNSSTHKLTKTIGGSSSDVAILATMSDIPTVPNVIESVETHSNNPVASSGIATALANKADKSAAVTNISLDGTTVKKTINGTTSNAFSLPEASGSSKGIVQIDTTLPATSSATTTKVPSSKGVASALDNKINKYTDAITIYKESGDNTSPSDVIKAPNAVASKQHVFALPSKSGNSGTVYTLATTDDIPAAITIDSTLSSSSTNPVQNKAIYNALADKAEASYLEQALNDLDQEYMALDPSEINIVNSSTGKKSTLKSAASSANATFNFPAKAAGTYTVATTVDLPVLATAINNVAADADKVITNSLAYTALAGKVEYDSTNEVLKQGGSNVSDINFREITASDFVKAKSFTTTGGDLTLAGESGTAAKINIKNASNKTTIIQPGTSATATPTLTLPSSTGTLALTSDINTAFTNKLDYDTTAQNTADIGVGAIRIYNGATSSGNYVTLTANSSVSGNKAITLPNKSGTLATLDDVNGVAMSISVVQSLPASGNNRTIYLMAKSPAGSGQNVYNEYVWTGSAFELIGDTAVDLTGYWNSSNLSAMDASDLHDLLDEVFPE